MPPRHLFARGAQAGRVDSTRAGNTVTAATRGVAAFTLLVSPAQFDFSKPVKVVVNGRTTFDGKVEKTVRRRRPEIRGWPTRPHHALRRRNRTQRARTAKPHGRCPAAFPHFLLRARSITDTSFDGPFAV